MNIIDIMQNNIKAVCTFKYKGYIVSLSTVFKVCPIGIFKGEEEHYTDTVEQAISLIDDITTGDSEILSDEDIYSCWCENSVDIPELAMICDISEKEADRIVNAGLELDNKATF